MGAPGCWLPVNVVQQCRVCSCSSCAEQQTAVQPSVGQQHRSAHRDPEAEAAGDLQEQRRG
jgi:hypothetical protein